MVTPAAIGVPLAVRMTDLSSEIFDPADLAAATITPALKARSAAFLILAHAEIERAVEDECSSTASLLEAANEPAIAMLAWGFASLRSDGTILKWRKKQPLEHLVDAYKSVVDSNNGIRRNNLEKLLIPLGVDLKALNTNISTLDVFGNTRGELAHQPLATWNTTDLPSVHVRNGVQAGHSADQVIAAIRAGHSQIARSPHSSARTIRQIRRSIARLLRKAATTVDN